MPLPFALDHINLWLLADGEGWAQVDCGYGDAADPRALGMRISPPRSRAGRIKRVIATHYHPDHLGNAAWLTARFGCPLIMPQAEFLTAHMVANGAAGYSDRCDLRTVSRARDGRRAPRGDARARQQLPARRARIAGDVPRV